MALEKAINEVRELVRGKDVSEYVQKNSKKIVKKYDLNIREYHELLSRLRTEQIHGTIEKPKDPEEKIKAAAEKKAAAQKKKADKEAAAAKKKIAEAKKKAAAEAKKKAASKAKEGK